MQSSPTAGTKADPIAQSRICPLRNQGQISQSLGWTDELTCGTTPVTLQWTWTQFCSFAHQPMADTVWTDMDTSSEKKTYG